MLSCVLSCCLSACLSVSHLCAPIVRSVCNVWLPFLLNNYAIHSRASTRQLFSQTVSRSLSALVSHQSGSNVQAETFHYVGKLCYTAGCQLCHNNGRWPLKSPIRGYLRVCVQGWWCIKLFWQRIWCSVRNKNGSSRVSLSREGRVWLDGWKKDYVQHELAFNSYICSLLS